MSQLGQELQSPADVLRLTGLGTRPGPLYRHFKRGFDLTLALAAGIVILPFALLLILLIRRDGGPAFYFQQRIGRGGRIFRMWKFRSMVPDADKALEQYLAANPAAREEWHHTQKLRHDPRITPLGRLMRKYSIDELPQIWNVIAGDMSLVGPRPMMPQQRTLYGGSAYFQFRPGLTGLWQVSARNECSFAERAEHDTRYAQLVGFWTDLRIMFETVAVVCRGTGL